MLFADGRRLFFDGFGFFWHNYGICGLVCVWFCAWIFMSALAFRYSRRICFGRFIFYGDEYFFQDSTARVQKGAFRFEKIIVLTEQMVKRSAIVFNKVHRIRWVWIANWRFLFLSDE